MNPAATAVTNLYRRIGDDFARRFVVLATNVKRQLLEAFITAPNLIHSDPEELLGDLSAGLIQVQKAACLEAEITEEQKQDFENRLDSTLAEAIIIIRDCFSRFGDRTLPAFQLETAKRLGIGRNRYFSRYDCV